MLSPRTSYFWPAPYDRLEFIVLLTELGLENFIDFFARLLLSQPAQAEHEVGQARHC